MNVWNIGIIHPGQMGISVAAAALHGGHTVWWAAEGRSEETRQRAEAHGLKNSGSFANLCTICDLIISVCPPHAADAVAEEAIACGFRGLYLDANAIAPERAVAMGKAVNLAGGTFVDGGIIGGPAWTPGTILYLAGPRADEIAACFEGSPLAVRLLGAEVGKASALKMCYAAYSKGTTALLAAILACAERLGVRTDLARQWNEDDPGFADRAEARARMVTAKAWRFVGEMEEIASTFRGAGLPGGFHEAAADLYRRLEHFKAEAPENIDDVLAALLRGHVAE
ncbi:MAG TPA: DUF1932 domain-containing protein [Candidatus Kapabacteria bacterium]|nr:DUF1932 domain-containing protein [Candidatus Kapabacteria bacterium]